ncbi:MAG: glycosyltransferase family 2 protein [Planctomycetales bacterium]|nr:glycosyltransferase family 2 protein [Planctomycetales bacterium]
MKRLSVIIPVYNERATIRSVIARFEELNLEDVELILVDDGSSDGTTEILQEAAPVTAKLILQPSNGGKTSAVRAGLAVATGDWVLVQDADLEYDPADIPRLLAKADSIGGGPLAVYGKRPSYWSRPRRWMFAAGVLAIDVAMLAIHRRWVRDHATCYKLTPRHVLESFQLESTGFEGCVEITAKLMRAGIPIYQIPIAYHPRRTNEGKKLTASYGWTALKAAWHWRTWRPRPVHRASQGSPAMEARPVADANTSAPAEPASVRVDA